MRLLFLPGLLGLLLGGFFLSHEKFLARVSASCTNKVPKRADAQRPYSSASSRRSSLLFSSWIWGVTTTTVSSPDWHANRTLYAVANRVALMAALGVGSVVLGLALQDTLSGLFSGVKSDH